MFTSTSIVIITLHWVKQACSCKVADFYRHRVDVFSQSGLSEVPITALTGYGETRS